MKSARPANNWNSFEHWQRSWIVEFHLATPGPDLLGWQQVVFDAGERHGIYRVDHVEEDYRYDRAEDGYFGDFVRAHPDRIVSDWPELPPGFALDDHLGWRGKGTITSSLLDYVTPEGTLAQTWVSNLGPLAYTLGVPDPTFPYPPFSLTAGVDPDEEPESQLGFEFYTRTDIFFPWNIPFMRSDMPQDQPLDNTVLAELNGRRLQAFLSEIRAAATAVGGKCSGDKWKWGPDEGRHS